MNKREYRILMMVFGLTVVAAGMSDAHTQATLSVATHPDTTPTLGVRISPEKDYAVTSEVRQPTGGKVVLKPTRAGHTGKGEIGYQVTPRGKGGTVQWNARMTETTQGTEAMNTVPFNPFPPMPVAPMPPFPPTAMPPMGIDFPVPPMPGQPPVMPRFPSGVGLVPQPMMMPPVMPPAFWGAGGRLDSRSSGSMPHIPDTARSVSDSTGEGEVNYYRAPDGSSQGMKWSSNSSSTTRTTWPARKPE